MITFQMLLENLADIKKFRAAVANILSVDNRVDHWRGTLKELMSQNGFKMIGSGKYGAVFSHPTYPYIIKVFMRDAAYLKWLDFCSKNQDNPYVPKIKGKVVRIGNVFMAIRLEKLSPGGNPSDLYRDDDNGNRFATRVVDELERNPKLMDLHGDNVMLRGNQLVIIDPYYNWFKDGRFTLNPDDMSAFKELF